MRFEWDEQKNAANQENHDGLSFEVAALVFADEFCLVYPDRLDSVAGEQRWHALGRVRGLAVYLVVHVYRKDKDTGEEIIRIISARAAEKRESRRYFQRAAD